MHCTPRTSVAISGLLRTYWIAPWIALSAAVQRPAGRAVGSRRGAQARTGVGQRRAHQQAEPTLSVDSAMTRALPSSSRVRVLRKRSSGEWRNAGGGAVRGPSPRELTQPQFAPRVRTQHPWSSCTGSRQRPRRCASGPSSGSRRRSRRRRGVRLHLGERRVAAALGVERLGCGLDRRRLGGAGVLLHVVVRLPTAKIATAARMPRIATTTRSSMRVKPCSSRFLSSCLRMCFNNVLLLCDVPGPRMPPRFRAMRGPSRMPLPPVPLDVAERSVVVRGAGHVCRLRTSRVHE